MTLSTVRCRILGQAEIHTKGIRLTPESDLQFGLALYFCTQAGRELPRDELARLFWPTHSMEAARHCLRQAIYRLRVLGVAVRSGAGTAVLDAHFIEADFAGVAVDGAPSAAFLKLTDVTVLPGYSPRFSRTFARWVEDFRTEVGSRLRRGLVRAISEMRARGRYADVERLCRFCLQLDPLNEEATLALAESVALAGGKAEAVGLIDRYAGEIGHYRPELRVSASLLRERISDRLIRRSQAAVELPMVGREQDVERLMSAFQRLRGNRAVSYVITGGAGVGKTRLAFECCRMAELQGARLLTIGTQPSSRTQALFAVSELVDGLLRMPGAIGCAPSALECLRSMSSPVAHNAMQLEADGEARFAMVRWSILDVLDAILVEGPLVIHVDDAHQLDPQSQAILEDALRTHAGRPLLLLLTMRPPDWADAKRFVHLVHTSILHDLLPLNDESCNQLVCRFSALKEDELDDATRERIIQLSGGNPFFLVELLKHRSQLASDQLPATVQAILEDRFHRLSPSSLTLLRAAAVLGLNSTADRLHRMLEGTTADVLVALTELHRSGMLAPLESSVSCRHDTIREAVLERIPVTARMWLHRRAGTTLGVEGIRDGSVALLWDALHHLKLANATRGTIRMAFALAKRLQSLGLAQDSLDVLEEVRRRAETPSDKLRLLRSQARAYKTLRDWPSLKQVIHSWYTERQNLYAGNTHHCSMELLGFEAHYNAKETYGSLPKEIMACVRTKSASTHHRLAAATLAMIRADNDGDVESATSVFNSIADLAPQSRGERIKWLTSSAIFHAAFGDINQTPEVLLQLLDLAQSIPQPALRSHYVRRACFGIARYVDPDLAATNLRQCLDVSQQLRLTNQQLWCIEELGLLSLHHGSDEETLSWINQVRAIAASSGEPVASGFEFELRVLLAVNKQDARYLPDFDVPLELVKACSHSRRARQSILALTVLRAVLLGQGSSHTAHIEELRGLFEVMKSRGYQDTVVTALVFGLLDNGDLSTAPKILKDYVEKYRREVLPLPLSLRRLQIALLDRVESTPSDEVASPGGHALPTMTQPDELFVIR